jgi:hypothetical protein
VQSKSHEIMCHPEWRLPRQFGLHILYLPDGNNRTTQNLKGYAGGANTVVEVAHSTAKRGDVAVAVFCIISDLNAQKRPEAFFQALVEQFSRLWTSIVHKGYLIRADIRCRVFGNLEKLKTMGGARQKLVEEVEAVCKATESVIRPKMFMDFWLAYSTDIAYESDIDLVVRTGAEDPEVARPGLSLPLNVPCIVTKTLWPEVQPAEIEALIDGGLRDVQAQFGRGYDLTFAESLLRSLPLSRVPAKARLSLPVCAPEAEIIAMLQRVYANPQDGPEVLTQYFSREGTVTFGATEDIWYTLRIIPAARWFEFAAESYDAIITPGQHAGTARLAMPAGQAHVHSCVSTVDGVLDAFHRAVQFPMKHVLLHGADRSQAASLKCSSPWSIDLLELMHAFAQHPQWSVEDVVRAHAPPEADIATETAWRIQSLTAKVLGRALAEGLILPDEEMERRLAPAAQSITTLLVSRSNAQVESTFDENAAEVVVRSLLALTAGEHGIFERVYPGETQVEKNKRIAAAAQGLAAEVEVWPGVAPEATRSARLVRLIRKQWQQLLDARLSAGSEWVELVQGALRRHYGAKEREQAPEVLDNPHVQWLCFGGLPRREAMRDIEQRYASTTPRPIGERIRHLLETDVTEDGRFQQVRREMQALLYLAETTHRRGLEVLAFFCALAVAPNQLTKERLQAIQLVGQLADYRLQISEDLADLDQVGQLDGKGKTSALTILLPKMASISDYMVQLRLARETGRKLKTCLDEEYRRALQALQTLGLDLTAMLDRVIQFRQNSSAADIQSAPSIAEIRAMLQDEDLVEPTSPESRVVSRLPQNMII